jgi:hypothetical protein
MELVSLCPLRAASIVWQPARGAYALTVVVRATFDLAPAESPLAKHQEHPSDADNHWNDDPARSVHVASDLAPFKARADITLVGHAFAPRAEPVHSLVAGLLVGEVDKSIEVFGQRTFTQAGELREGARFTKMPLRWERAAGGPDTMNPVGMRPDAADLYGAVAVPNLQPTGLLVTTPADFIQPIGFGPVAPSWPQRREKLGRHAATWSTATWTGQPWPDDIDPSFWNAAPPDQQIAAIRDNERIILQNLHPKHGRLVTSLPGLRPKAFVETTSAAPSELPLVCDTLHIDTDRAACALTWRGQLPLEGPAQPGTVLIAMEGPGQRITWDDILALRSEARPTPSRHHWIPEDEGDREPEEPSSRRIAGPTVPSASSLPRRRPRDPLTGTLEASSSSPKQGDALPFVKQDQPVALPTEPRAARAEPRISRIPGSDIEDPDTASTSDRPTGSDATPAWLAASGSAVMRSPVYEGASAPQSPAAVPPGLASLEPAPPARMPIPATPPGAIPPPPAELLTPPAAVIAPPVNLSPWATSSMSAMAPAAPITNVPWSPSPQDPGRGAPGPQDPWDTRVLGHGPAGGAVAASDAAAAASTEAAIVAPPDDDPAKAQPAIAPTRGHAREYLDLLWYDRESVARVRSTKAFRPALEQSAPKDAGWLDDIEEPVKEAPEVADRRDILRVMTRSAPVESEGMSQALADAIDEDGLFTTPLILASSDLTFPFDEIETLKAMVAVSNPLVGADKKLRETVDAATDVLKSEWPAPPDVLDALIVRIKEAFSQGPRAVAPGYLESCTEKRLLEGRHYQKKTVLGEPRVRALLATHSSSTPIPTYLPDALSKKLPLFQRIKATLIAEVHGQQDQYEAHPIALVVLAIARVLPIPALARQREQARGPGRPRST